MDAGRLRTHVPDLNADDIEFDTLVGEMLVSERLARRADAFFETRVHPETVVAVAVNKH